ncbi:MAG: hypothetical protein HYT80_08885 [Euryarchaeota archaeon]|nr:hypothetical protein [Euryarchaeota archaeon]
MRLHRTYSAVAAAMVGFVAIALYGIHLAAPTPSSAEPTGFSEGSGNTTQYVRTLQEMGNDVRAIVSSGSMLDDIATPASAVVVLLSPSRQLTDGEDRSYARFLSAGGTAWVADPSGVLNTWLAPHGVAISDRRLLDPTSATPSLVRLGAPTPSGGIEPILADASGRVYIEDPQAWSVLLESRDAHLDIDGNGSVDRWDEPGPHPVLAVRHLAGGGRLIVSADDSVLRNRNMARGHSGNVAFVQSVSRLLLPERGEFVLDESMHGLTGAEPYLVPVLRATAAARQLGVIVGVITAGILVAALGLIRVVLPRWTPYQPHRSSIPVDPAPPLTVAPSRRDSPSNGSPMGGTSQ